MPFKIRPIHFRRSYTRYAEGSVLVSMGNTKVLCNASVSEDVPSFLKGKGKRLGHGGIFHVAAQYG
jgi:ribonuclease PH